MAVEREDDRVHERAWDDAIREAYLDEEAPGSPSDGTGSRPSSRFQVLSEERNGGATSVIRVRDRDLDREVALEVLAERVESATEQIRGFLAEAQVVAQLQHPGILPVLGLGFLEDGRPFVARRLADGETLATLLSRGEESRPRLLGIVEQAAQAMAYAHARGVAHGSLEPSRVVRGAHGEVVVAGWERAARVNGDRGPVSRDIAALVEMLTAVTGTAPSRPPRSSGEIVLAIGRHLGAAESRARTAELGAAKAAARAERERARHEAEQRRVEAARRSRRRVLATTAAVLLAVALGGAGLLWKRSEDRQAADGVEREIVLALREAERYEAAERWNEARAWARKARALLGGSGEAVEVLERIDRRARLVAEDGALLAAFRDVESIWRHPREVTEDYERVFRTHGIHLLSLDLEEAARAINSRSRRDEVLVTLNEWLLSEGRRERVGMLLALLDRVDPDPWRRRLREARDEADLREVAATADASSSPGSLLHLLGRVLVYRGLTDEAEDVLREAHRRDPSDRLIAQAAKEAVEREPEASVGVRRARRSVAASAAAVAVAPDEPRHWLNLGTSLALLRDDEESERCYLRALDLKPEYEKARHNLAAVRVRLGRTEEAYPEVRRMLDRDPVSARAHHLLARILAARGDEEEALRELRAAAELAPNQSRYLEDLARFEEARGAREEAIALKRRVGALAPETETGLLARATALALEGDFEAAEAVCRKAIALDPERPQAHRQLAVVLRGAGRYAEAIEAARQAVTLDGRNADYRHRLGHCLADGGDLEGAAMELREAVRLSRDPVDLGVRLCLGSVLSGLGRLDEARRVYEQAERVARNSSVGLAARGIRLYLLDRFEEAIEPLRRAVRDPGLESRDAAWDTYLACLRRAGRREEAIAACRTELEGPRLDGPRRVYLLTNLAAMLCEDRPAEAARAYREALAVDPRCMEARAGLGWVLLVRGGQTQEGIEHLRKALEVEPTGRFVPVAALDHLAGLAGVDRAEAIRRGYRAWILVNLGDAYRITGRPDDAVAAYREATRLDPGEVWSSCWLGLAKALLSKGELAGFIDALRKTVDTHPEDPKRLNDLAWNLATCPEPELRNPEEAVRLAEKAVELTRGGAATIWNTLGVARYRAGKHRDAIAALLRSRAFQDPGSFVWDGLYLAMAHARLGRAKEARDWYDRSVRAMAANATGDEELDRLREEAAKVLGIR